MSDSSRYTIHNLYTQLHFGVSYIMITEGPRNEQHNWRGGVSDRVGPAGRMQRIQEMLGSRQAPLGYSHGRAYTTMAFFLACSLTCAAGHVKSKALYICTQRLMNPRNAVPRESTRRWSHEKERSRVTKGANGRRGTVTSLWVQWNG